MVPACAAPRNHGARRASAPAAVTQRNPTSSFSVHCHPPFLRGNVSHKISSVVVDLRKRVDQSTLLGFLFLRRGRADSEPPASSPCPRPEFCLRPSCPCTVPDNRIDSSPVLAADDPVDHVLLELGIVRVGRVALVAARGAFRRRRSLLLDYSSSSRETSRRSGARRGYMR